MLKISKLADYATLIMGHLSEFGEAAQSVAQISETLNIPAPTVSKILKRLNESSLVESIRGPSGGYHLKQSAACISIASIITAIDGKPAMTECSQKMSACLLEPTCGLRGNWRKINRYVLEVLEKISLAEMNKPITQPLKFYEK